MEVSQAAKSIQGGTVITWENLATGDTGSPVGDLGKTKRMLQVKGTFAGGTSATLEGSNDGVTYVTLNDTAGNPLVFAAAGMKAVAEFPLYTRPKVTAGAADSVDFILSLAE